MRIGVAWFPNVNANYRAIMPIQAMAARGHSVVGPLDKNGAPDPRRLAGCDVVHVYRRLEPETRGLLKTLVNGGKALVYDNDDDFSATPKESLSYKEFRGRRGQQFFNQSVRMAKLATVCTTTNHVLAEKYRHAGVESVEVVGNYLSPRLPRPPRRRGPGVVIGWVAAGEHQADADRVGIADALRRIVAEHENVRVECFGVDLKLGERYSHERNVPFSQLSARLGAWDIGIAALADIPFNRTRSDIKLKEYASAGVTWLASPVGPYRGLGESEGGRLVPDDRWFDAIDALVRRPRDRRRLARRGHGWAKRNTIDAIANRWEQIFLSAARSVGRSV